MKSLNNYINERLITNKDEILLTPKSKDELVIAILDHFNNGVGNLNDIDVSKLDEEDFYSLFSDLDDKIEKNKITEINISKWKIKGLYCDPNERFGMFEECYTLESVILPDCLEMIEELSFYDCTNLDNIIIPDSVKIIDDYAFQDCTSLTSVTISSSVNEIGKYVFAGCTKLISITIPESIDSINYNAFYNCTDLIITVPNEDIKKLVRDSGFNGKIIIK